MQITVVDSTLHETAHRFPRFLPDGRHYEFVTLPGHDGKLDTWVGELGSPKRTLVASTESGALFAPPHHMVFVRDQSLMAQPFDLGRLRLTGEPMRIGDAPENLQILGSTPASASEGGILVYPTNTPTVSHLLWVGRDGKPQGNFPVPPGDYREIVLSPDNRQVALLRRESPTNTDIWIADAVTGAMSRLTTDGIQRFTLQWSGDGAQLAYAASHGGEYDFWQRAASGSDEERPLFRSSSPLKNLSNLTRDGSYMVYDDIGKTTQRDLWVLPLKGDRKPVLYLSTPFNENSGVISPDGHWMLYQSDESGRPEMYVQSFPSPGSKVRISTGGGAGGQWRADGAEIIYASQQGAMSVSVPAGPSFAASAPKLLLTVPKEMVAGGATSDFKRFLVALTTGDARRTSLTLLTNWTSLRQR